MQISPPSTPKVRFYVSENWNLPPHCEPNGERDKFNFNAFCARFILSFHLNYVFLDETCSESREKNANAHQQAKRRRRRGNRKSDDEKFLPPQWQKFLLHSISAFFLFIYAPLCHYSHCRCIADCNCRRILRKVYLLNQKKRFAGAIEESSSDKSFYGEKFLVELELAFPGSDANSMCSTTLNGLRLGSRR